MEEGELQKLLDEYYKLDYEDTVGGLRTRFRYKQVPSQQFGMSLEDVLRHSDKELNQVIGMKRLAPYREDQARQKPNYKALETLKGSAPEGGFQKHRKQIKQNKPWEKNKGREQSSNSTDGYKLPEKARRSDKRERDERKLQHSKPSKDGKASEDGAKDGKVSEEVAKDGKVSEEGAKDGEQAKKKRKKNNKEAKGDGEVKEAKPAKDPKQARTASYSVAKEAKPAKDPKLARMASYARLSLNKGEESGKGGFKPEGGAKKEWKDKKEGGEAKPSQAAAVVADGPHLLCAAATEEDHPMNEAIRGMLAASRDWNQK
eukprot:gene1660-33055_t